MKRCPECLFIYPESDTRCDFDNALLVVVDDAEIESATSSAPAAVPPNKKRASGSKKDSTGAKKRSRKKGGAITAAVGVVFGLGSFGVYYSLNSRVEDVGEIPPVATGRVAVLAPLAVPAPVKMVLPLPVEKTAPSPNPVAKSVNERSATSHSRTTAAPVSTSGPGMGKSARPVILLSRGGRIDADEVWRTRDGVWYRRSGVVTLLKHNRVKGIVNQ